jgi:hypothetical protein
VLDRKGCNLSVGAGTKLNIGVVHDQCQFPFQSRSVPLHLEGACVLCEEV